MADEEDKATGSLSVEDALKMYEDHKSYWNDNYRQAAIDLKMASGDKSTHWGNGWDDNYKAAPAWAVVVNELPQYIHQVTNDIRQNVPSIKVLPVSDGDIETGEIYSGLFRAIEDHSHADEVCDTAAEYAVTCGIGFMRLDHDYCDDKSDEQEIIFKTVPDPLSVWIDPASVEYDGRDANSSISLEPINKKDFERLYPDKAFISFTDPKNQEPKDTINIAEIFVRETSGERGKSYIVKRYKFSGEDRLAQTTFPGKYIPTVPIYGQVTWIDGKRIISSLIRQSRDPQRRLNHLVGKESQTLAMAPIAPIQAVEGTIVNERKQYQIPGLENVLEYRQRDLNGDVATAPIRLMPPAASSGFIEAIASAKEDIKESMGIYNAGLGKREGDASGIALQQLDRSGDVATFHYPDNVRRSYGHMGEVAVEMMPVIYDTPRVIQTLNDETDVVMVGVNGAPMQDGQKQAYDLTKGKYRVRITTGASYTTKRQEEAAFLQEAFKADPALMQIGGDILFKSMDTPGAQAMAARMKKMLPPQLQDDNTQDPQVIALTQQLQKAQAIIQQGAGEIQQLQQQLESKQGDQAAKMADLQLKGGDQKLKEQELQLKMQVEQLKAQNENLKLQLEAEKLEIEREKLEQSISQPEMEPPISSPQPIGIKLDTTGFQMMKTPEQEAIESSQAETMQQQQAMRAQQEEQERLDRQQQTTAVINSLGNIAQTLTNLTAQVSAPKRVMRDENGAIVGVN